MTIFITKSREPNMPQAILSHTLIHCSKNYLHCGVPKESQLERGLEVSHDGLMDSRSPETSWDKESFMIKVGRNMRSWDTKKGTNPNHGSRSKLIEGFPPLGWVGT